jgi:hypothetical protein
MTDEVRSIGALRLDDRRTGDRRSAQRRAAPAAETPEAAALAPDGVDAAEAPARPAPTPPTDASPAAFAAQMLGQSGQKRGLRGGPPVLGAARHTYLGAEYSGPAERRPLPGKATDTDV